MMSLFQRTSIVAVVSVLSLSWLSGCTLNRQPEPAIEPFPSTLEAVSAAQPAQRKMPIESWRTDEGARVLFVQSSSLPMLDVRLVFDAGSARDEEAGTAYLASALIGEGASGLDVDAIARGFEDRGAQFGTASYRDMAIVELRTLTEREFYRPVTDLFVKVVAEPTFPADALERIRGQVLVSLARERQVPSPQVSKQFNRVLFADHPYAHPPEGTAETLPQIDGADLAAFHRQYYGAANAVIALVGDLERKEAEALAARISAALPRGQRALPLPRAETLQQRQAEHITFPSSQTILMLGNQAIWRGHPDWVPLYVGNQILGGGGFASILTEEVREKRGFVYGIGSAFSPMAAAGPFIVQLQTANENADEALKLTLRLLRDFVREGPTAEQVENARNHLVGSFALEVAENDDIVGNLGAIGFYDLPLDYLQWFESEVRKVTREQIHSAFLRNLDVRDLAVVSIGPRAPQMPKSRPARIDAEPEPRSEAAADAPVPNAAPDVQ